MLIVCIFVFFFFFSSRRRHTRLQGDWSSDVCSSDLSLPELGEIINQQDIKGKESDEGETLRNKEGDNQQIERASCRERV